MMCSVATAEGLALVSYPLYQPGRHERLRVEHFAHFGMPCLFVYDDQA